MSNEKSSMKYLLKTKESRSIYLSLEDWDWLKREGKGHPTHAIRKMILAFRQKEALNREG